MQVATTERYLYNITCKSYGMLLTRSTDASLSDDKVSVDEIVI